MALLFQQDVHGCIGLEAGGRCNIQVSRMCVRSGDQRLETQDIVAARSGKVSVQKQVDIPDFHICKFLPSGRLVSPASEAHASQKQVLHRSKCFT